MRTKSFTYDERQLEVRAISNGHRCEVGVFEGEVPANGSKYEVTHEVAIDAMPWDLVAELMDTAQGDFVRWSDWRKEEEEKKKKRLAADTQPSN